MLAQLVCMIMLPFCICRRWLFLAYLWWPTLPSWHQTGSPEPQSRAASLVILNIYCQHNKSIHQFDKNKRRMSKHFEKKKNQSPNRAFANIFFIHSVSSEEVSKTEKAGMNTWKRNMHSLYYSNSNLNPPNLPFRIPCNCFNNWCFFESAHIGIFQHFAFHSMGEFVWKNN